MKSWRVKWLLIINLWTRRGPQIRGDIHLFSLLVRKFECPPPRMHRAFPTWAEWRPGKQAEPPAATGTCSTKPNRTGWIPPLPQITTGSSDRWDLGGLGTRNSHLAEIAVGTYKRKLDLKTSFSNYFWKLLINGFLESGNLLVDRFYNTSFLLVLNMHMDLKKNFFWINSKRVIRT